MDQDAHRPVILWVDDEIDLLRSQIQFLESRGYQVRTVTNGRDAVALVRERSFAAVLLDEIMVGFDGIATLKALKAVDPSLPVIMVTKSTEETVMDDAYYGEISDFLVKPVNPHQIVSSLKKVLELDKLRRERFVNSWGDYYSRAQAIINNSAATFAEWGALYLEMCEAGRQINRLDFGAIAPLHRELVADADANFSRFVCHHYPEWVAGGRDRPRLAWEILDEYVFPHLARGKQVYFVVVDCLRLDQWLLLEERVSRLFRVERDLYCGALPSSTNYARNALFAGERPEVIAARFPGVFKEERGTGESLNKFEEQFLTDHVVKHFPHIRKVRYFKVAGVEQEKKVDKVIETLTPRPLTAFVFNFIDNLTHDSGRGGPLDTLAPTGEALPRLALTWYLGSPLEKLLTRLASERETVVVLTSDHGSTIADTPTVVFADKEATKTPRYWVGRDLRPEGDGAYLIRQPKEFGLPADYLAKSYVLALAGSFLVFSHHIREYQRRFEGGFFHGGVSLPELVLPVVTLTPK